MSRPIEIVSRDEFDLAACVDGNFDQPLLIRGLVQDWPLVKSSRENSEALKAYLSSFYSDRPITVYQAPSDANGRIFYNDSLTGFNFDRTQTNLLDFFAKLDGAAGLENGDTYYMGSTMLDPWFPGLRAQNNLDFGSKETLVSLWFGNQTLVAPHFDFPENIACVIAGKRKFTLYAPDQIENLYPGSVDFTPSGQPISMVDTRNPDTEAFPNFAKAQDQAIVAEMEPGDGIYIPSMWWHQVESFDDFSGLVNFWWRVTPAYLGSPLQALKHCLMSFNGLPVEQKKHWQHVFNYYLFESDLSSLEHIPEAARGSLGELSQEDVQQMKQQLIHFLKY